MRSLTKHSLYFLETLDLLLTCLATVIPTGKSPIVEWFQALNDTDCFSDPKSNLNPAILDPAYGLICLITLAFFDLSQDFSLKNTLKNSYIHNPQVLLSIDSIIQSKVWETLSTASPIFLGWSSVIHRISIRLSEHPNEAFDTFLATLTASSKLPTNASERIAAAEKLSEYAQNLASTAMEYRALDLVPEIFRVLPQRLDYANIAATFVQACLPYFNMTDSVAEIISSVISPFPELIDAFFSDPFADRALLLSKAKVPLATKPFVLLCKCLGVDAYDFVSTMTGYMVELPREFQDYEFISNSSTIVRLLSDFLGTNDDSVVIPAGTRGNLILDGAKTFVLWSMNYNGWTYFARLLEQIEISKNWEKMNLDILDLISTVLNALDDAKSNKLLNSLSAGVSAGDFIELSLKIFDSALLSQNVSLCISCTKFLSVLLRTNPDRVWPYLGRSRLLERSGKPSLLTSILGAVEIVNNNFDFTLSIISFVESLVIEGIAESLEKDINVDMKKQILCQFTKHLVDVYESFAYWRYSRPGQKVEIASGITQIFSTILRTCFRVEDEKPLDQKIVCVLAPSAQLLINAFLSSNKVVMRTLEPILGNIESISSSQNSLDSVDTLMSGLEMTYAEVSMRFASSLVRIRSILKLPCSLLESKLYAASPDLVQIFVRYFNLHATIMELLESLVVVHWPEEQPSLLAHLGTEYSKIFISNLKKSMKNDLEREHSIVSIASFFAAIVESQQEGLCTLLITGRDTRSTSASTDMVDSSLLTVFENQAADHWKEFDNIILDPILNAIGLAHNTWTLGSSTHREALTKSLLQIIIDDFDAKPLDKNIDQEEYLRRAALNLVASRAVNILAIQLFKQPDNWNREVLEFLDSSDNLESYSKTFLLVCGFRASLHGNLHRNFDKKWSGSKLAKYAKSELLLPRIYSASYLYDLGLLDSILGRDPVWVGYRREIVEANVNLSYIDSQLCMIRAWTSFLTSLTLHAIKTKNHKTLNSLRLVASIAISSNLHEVLQYPAFEMTVKIRLETAFFILFNISKISPSINIYKESDLEQSFKLLTDPSLDFLNAISGLDNAKEKFYEPLLKIISLLLGKFSEVGKSNNNSELENLNVSLFAIMTDENKNGKVQIKSTLYQIISRIVDIVAIKGMKAIISLINDSRSTSATEDIVQITSILSKCLELPGMVVGHSTFVAMMSDSGCERSVLSLYSYAMDANVNGDPIYGELSLYYIQEWLTVEAMADHFVINGLFGVLNQSPVSKEIQKGGISPATAPRLHNIWTKGILNIVLLLLRQLGSRIVPEMLLFINYFRRQIEFVTRSWVDPNLITVSIINESSQILIMLEIITKICEADQSSHIPQFISNQDLIDALDYLLNHGRYLASKVAATNIEEQKLSMEKTSDGYNALVSKVIMELSDLRQSLDYE